MSAAPQDADRMMPAAPPAPGYTHGGAMAALGLAVVLWASSFAGIRAVVGTFGPGELALLRFAVATCLLLAWARVQGAGPPSLRDGGHFVVAGVLGITVYHLALNSGAKSVTAGAASFLVNTVPMFTALLAAIFFQQGLSPRGWTGVAVSMAGVALIAAGEGEGFVVNQGAGLVLLSAFCQSIYFILQKPLLQRYAPATVVAWTVLAGTLPLIAFVPGLASSAEHAPPAAILAGVYLGVFPGAVAYASYTYALRGLSAPVAAATLYAVPVVALPIAWIWLREVPSLLAVAGGSAALLGVAIVTGCRK